MSEHGLDRYAYGRYTPPIDPIQNWFLTNAEVEDGYTVLEFYCNFITCDDCDLLYFFLLIVTSGNEPFVYHIVIYLCDGLYESDLGAEGSGECYGGVSDHVADCNPICCMGSRRKLTLLIYPIGGAKSPHYAVIELHYNNLDHISGIVDSSGIEFTYIDTPREYNAGVMTVGHINDNTMVIPPNTVDYSVTGLCLPECTRNFLPPDGVKVFANMFHTNTAGSKLIVCHIRHLECSPGVSRYEELSPIDKNYHYMTSISSSLTT
uniref:Uncharacterized protein n=1 Tax=Amphimedon queenslandica TaxID=400682 RepID=A0A1X7TY90_AMPQE